MKRLVISRPASDGGGLRWRLIALVLVPLVGASAFSFAQIQERLSREHSARTVQNLIRTVVAVDAARAGLQQEIVPGLAVAVLRTPNLAHSLHLASLAGVHIGITPASLGKLRAITDGAFATAEQLPGTGTEMRASAAKLKAIRARMDAGAGLASVYDAALALAGSLTVIENREVAQAGSLGLQPAAAASLNDVVLIARATELGEQEVPLYAATKLPLAGASVADAQLSWLTAWGGFQTASDTVIANASTSMRLVWEQVLAAQSSADFSTLAASAITTTATSTQGAELLSLASVISAVRLDGVRNRLLAGVLTAAAARANGAAVQQHLDAVGQLRMIVALSVLLFLASIGIALIAYRFLARPLDRLSRQALQVSEGELPDVTVGGPREVRTVARGLSAAVTNLRRIQDQAEAVAAGRLDSDVVRQPLPGRLGSVVHASVTQIIDAIHDRDTAQSDLAHRAAHDALTELPNRAQALSLIERSLHRAQRSSAMTGLMFVDLDNFKQVNDTLGHGTGDVVLQLASRRMQATVRDGDTLARLGGDEFVILLEDVDSEADFVKLAERIIAEVSAPMQIGERDVSIGASIGVAICRDGYVDASRLLREADAAVYRAKNSGRGRVGIFDDDLRHALEARAVLEDAISTGLVQGEFVLHYQPVVDMRDGRTLGVEALIRWHRPGHGMVAPDGFIPVAEMSSLIDDIGRWALLEATRQLATWTAEDAGAADLTVAVNISGRHLTSSTLTTDVQTALRRSGIAPHRLVVEITETVLVDDPVATTNMQALRELGVQIAIDDFGTGYTSIGQLPRLPVDTLKIDRSFIASEDPAHQELVRLIVSAAHAFNLTVVAEGVEFAHQADAVRDAHAETGQGFFFARPQPADHFNPATIELWAGLADSGA